MDQLEDKSLTSPRDCFQRVLTEEGWANWNVGVIIAWVTDGIKGVSELSTAIHFSLLPGCGCLVTSSFLLLLPYLPHHDGLYSSTIRPNKPFLSLVSFIMYDITITRKVVNIIEFVLDSCWLRSGVNLSVIVFYIILLLILSQTVKNKKEIKLKHLAD